MRKSLCLLILISSFSLLLILGCATTDLETMKADINQLKRDSYDFKKETSELRSAIKKESGSELFNALRDSQAQLSSEVSGISKDLQVLIGRFDENKHFMDKSLKERASEMELLRSQISSLDIQMKEMQAKLSAIEAKAVSPAETKKEEPQRHDAKPDDTKASDTRPAEAKTPEAKDPTKHYETALNTYKEKKYKEAREKFESFLKEYPKDKLAGNAQFWLAETYYAEEDYAGAIVEYDVLLKNYPTSDKTIGALLKQGYAFIEMGDKKAGKGILEQLVQKYPKAKEAELAKKKIEEISKKTR